jgi:hypothetical protein
MKPPKTTLPTGMLDTNIRCTRTKYTRSRANVERRPYRSASRGKPAKRAKKTVGMVLVAAGRV